MASKVRVWVAGPRGWENRKPIEKVMHKLVANYGIARLLVMTGGAPGVDHLVEEVCNEMGVHVFACRACWPIGRAAGPIRNGVIAEEFEPILLIALHYYPLSGTNHKGTRSAIKQARKLDVPVKILRVSPATAIPSSVADASPEGRSARAAQGVGPRPKKLRRRRRDA